MDNLTHGLTGALMAQAGLKKKTGLGMAALIFGANLPDLDVVSMLWLDGTETLGFRRGITHGPIGIALLPLGLAALLYWFDRWQAKRGKRPEARRPVSFKWLYLLGVIGAISHSLMDWLNVYGVRFLYPFDTSWYYGDTLFIIDVWLWVLMGLALWFSLRQESKGENWQNPARAMLAFAMLYIAGNYAITTYQEETAARKPAIASPLPLLSWEREMIEPQVPGRWLVDGEPLGECRLEPVYEGAKGNSYAEAFLVWSRTPFALRGEESGVVLYDARFYDPRARDRFSIALPDVACEELR